MINIKGTAITQDGTGKRIAITYDEINEDGKVINSNARINRIVVDEDVLNAISVIDTYAKTIIDNEV